MKRRDWRCRTTTIGSARGAEVPSCTMTMTTAAAATGATVCITIQSWQWSASVEFACWWVTWAMASNDKRTRHRTATAGKKPCQELRFP